MKNRMAVSIIFILCIGSIVEGAAYPPDGWRMPSVFVDQPGQQKFSEIYVKGDTIHAMRS